MNQIQRALPFHKVQIISSIKERKSKVTAHLFSRIPQGIKGQRLLRFDELNGDVAVGLNLCLRQVQLFTELRVIIQNSVMCQSKLCVCIASKGVIVVVIFLISLCRQASVTHDSNSPLRNPKVQLMCRLRALEDRQAVIAIIRDTRCMVSPHL